jgi:hypothetical protein
LCAGLGGLLNIAEMAWQQDDIYCSNQYAIATVSILRHYN